MKTFLRVLLIGSVALLVACQNQLPLPTPTPIFVTATLPPTPLPPVAPSPTATTAASRLLGTTTARVNVRPSPGSQSEPLGILESGAEVEILGQDAGGKWYQIVYPDAPDAKGWVNAAYIRLPDDATVPTVQARDGSLPQAVVKETLNVRSRPDSGSTSLGVLLPQDVVVLSGKSSDGTWLQIEYPAGSSDRGWIAAAYVEALGVDELPILAEDGTPLAMPSPAVSPSAPAFTLLPAPQDGDSVQAPAAKVAFSPSGARQFRFTGQVSAPQGDLEDWVAFVPYSASGAQVTMRFRLECTGLGELTVRLIQEAGTQDLPEFVCGAQEQLLRLQAGQTYWLHFRVAGNLADLRSVGYIITIQNGP